VKRVYVVLPEPETYYSVTEAHTRSSLVTQHGNSLSLVAVFSSKCRSWDSSSVRFYICTHPAPKSTFGLNLAR
jgi:hypothetical protein